MSILKTLRSLPEYIFYEGYTFRLTVKGDFVGYFLTVCHSKKRYKKAAFKEGYWLVKDKVVASSQGSNYLFKVLLFDDSDGTYLQALCTLEGILLKNNIPLVEEEDVVTENIEYTELFANRLS
jgi:hypothetical protein